MYSITVAQAARFAALAMVLLAACQLVDNAGLLETSPMLVLLGSTVPDVISAGFFFAVSRKFSIRTVTSIMTWITLVLAVLLDALIAYVRFQQSVSYWTPFGNALSTYGWLLRGGWAIFLVAFALSPDSSRTRKVALLLAILSAPSAFNVAYSAFDKWLGILFDDIPRQALWRVLITPAIRTIYWASQILFLWTVSRPPLEQSIARLAP